MDKKTAQMIAQVWNDLHAGCTKVTRTKAEVHDNGLRGKNARYNVSIIPDGEETTGETFYHTKELGYVCDAFRVSAYVMWNKYDGYIEAVIS